ncbi:hypothetical protein J4573_21990 [Actinomadura barringtoniae]|uniref:Uncharacterized protein n=1 Tax=Actinomadura barringtoniae TaxID=1427535 RepID=A0A939PCC3_9ACTN|nr:hypothetical protein [Actinomadura barringtoniae]MBO2449788.1 hypothetical protein [Actinomadura barringtoniae]
MLPEVSYTVAIEWAYYAFIVLSAGCIVVAMPGDRLETRHDQVAIGLMYFWKYG